MKLKKLFAGLVASAMAVSTMASMTAFEATAATNGFTKSAKIFEFDTPATTLNAPGGIKVTYNSPNGWNDIGFGFSVDGDWKSCAFSAAKGENTTTFAISDIVANASISDASTATYGKIEGYNNTEIISVSYDSTYVKPATDTWINNGDGSYTFVVDKVHQDYNNPLGTGVSVPKGATFEATVETTGYAKFSIGSNSSDGWKSTDDQSFDSKGKITWTAPVDLENVNLFVGWFNDGVTVKVSDFKVVKKSVTLSAGDRPYWKTDVVNGKYNYRAALVCSKSVLEGKTGLTFTITTSGKTKEFTVHTYYTAVADTDSETYTFASDDLVIIPCLLKDIPEDVTVTGFETVWEAD